jgi:flagellar hook-length control protein FliK
MLNNALPVCNALPACIATPPGGTAAPVDGNAPFAHALGLAESQQRAASSPGAAGADTPAGAAPSGEPAAADNKPDATHPRGVRAVRAAAIHGRDVAADILPKGARPLQDVVATAADAARLGRGPEDDDAEHSAAQTPIDLAALIPGLALQPAPTNAMPAQRALPAGADTGALSARATARGLEIAQCIDEGADAVGKLAQALHAVVPGSLPLAGAAAAALWHARGVVQAGAASASAVGPTSAVAIDAPGTAMAQLRDLALRGRDGESGTPALAAGTPGAALLQGAPARMADSPPVFQAELHAALGSPEFAPALGAQLNTLVRDGIAHAQLHLNPAEMGPIAVRISLDGSNAQVDFSAAQPATRQALEDSVPALASALRESGLTLAGGGVFQQPRDARDTPRQAPARGSAPPAIAALDAASAGAAASAAAPRWGRARGVLDVFA